MAKVHAVKQDKPSRVILEMDFEEAVWVTSLLGAVHHATKIGDWNYALYSALHNVEEIARSCPDIYKQIKALCSLNTSAVAKPESWEFKFHYEGGNISESDWCRISEQVIPWPDGPTIVKVSFRKVQ